MDANDWLSLVHQTNDLVAQDRHGYPKVQRDLTGLLQSSQSARARTSRVRSQAEQAAATRLLAMQGFDAGRLNQDVAMLELQPTLEDVFHADTASVEDYLQQIQDMTILTAIQEAQQDAILSFERYMADCMTRDWASDKQGLYSSVAPFTGLGGGAGGGGTPGGGGAGAGAGGLSFGSVAARTDLGAAFAGAGKAGPKEQAYAAAVKQLNAAAAQQQQLHQAGGGGTPAFGVEAVAAFGAACEQYEDKAPDTLMSSCWRLLGDVLQGAAERGLAARGPPHQRHAPPELVDALLAGARGHLQAGFLAHMRGVVSRHRAAAQRGPDPDPLRDVQAYLAVRFRDRGPLDVQVGGGAAGGADTTWAQVYYALRAGLPDVALKAAERAADAAGGVAGRSGGVGGGAGAAAPPTVRQQLQHWLQDPAGFRARHGARLAAECERLLQGHGARQQQQQQQQQGGGGASSSSSGSLRSDYQLLVTALLAGDARTLDALFKLSPGLFPTMEDYVWAKLSLVSATAAAAAAAGGGGGSAAATAAAFASALSPGGGGAGQAPPPYSLAQLQAELNRWGPKYYTRDGREPLLFVTVLLLSLQFRRALAFLLRADMARAYRLDGVHLAIALHFAGVLAASRDLEPGSAAGGAGGGGAGGGAGGAAGGSAAAAALDADPLDLPGQLAAFGRRYVATDSATALQYYMLAAAVAGGGVREQGRLFRELLVASRDYGTLLGGGGALGAGGAIQQFVPDPEQRRALFEAVAYDCQVSQQPDEARELFMAAQRPRAALRIVNQQLSAEIRARRGELTDAASVLLSRGQAAVEAIAAAAPDAASRRDADAFAQLCLVRQMLELEARGEWGGVLQAAGRLSFLPAERARVEACKLEVRQLDGAVRERVPDVLGAVAGAIAALRRGADAGTLALLRERVACLKVFVLDLDPSVAPAVYERVNACVREFA